MILEKNQEKVFEERFRNIIFVVDSDAKVLTYDNKKLSFWLFNPTFVLPSMNMKNTLQKCKCKVSNIARLLFEMNVTKFFSKKY